MKIFAQYKNIIISAAICVFFLFIVKNIHANYIKQKAAIEAKKGVLAKKKEVIGRATKADNDYKAVVDKFIYKDSEAIKVAVEEEAQRAGIEINSLKSSQASRGLYNEVKISLESVSPYKNIVNFVTALEARAVDTEKVVIKNMSDKEGEGAIKTSFVFKSVIVRDEKAEAKNKTIKK